MELRKHSDQACYEFIAQGEVSPTVFSFLQGSPHTAHLQAQLTAVFEAIADGRKSPRVYPGPRKTDYDTLAGELTKRGWSQADMPLFSDEQALARASPRRSASWCTTGSRPSSASRTRTCSCGCWWIP